jgi:hypothetical protein
MFHFIQNNQSWLNNIEWNVLVCIRHVQEKKTAFWTKTLLSRW